MKQNEYSILHFMPSEHTTVYPKKKKDQSNGCKFPKEAVMKNEQYTYLYIQAPPATVFLQDPQCQIPTALLFILVCNCVMK